MPKLLPALAVRAAVVATVTAAAAVTAVLSAATAAAPAATAQPSVTQPSVTQPSVTQPSVTQPSVTQPSVVASTATPPTALAAASRGPVPAPAPVVTAPVVAVAHSSSAVSLALGKLGAPYRWGAAGPTAFDCSGLVKWAFAQTGVALPRTSRAMSRIGTPVSKAHLRPGDLVFFYHPVSHVAIYIGGGKVVHASSSRSPVKISDLDAMPFTAARRV